jgi:hypothetical protein
MQLVFPMAKAVRNVCALWDISKLQAAAKVRQPRQSVSCFGQIKSHDRRIACEPYSVVIPVIQAQDSELFLHGLDVVFDLVEANVTTSAASMISKLENQTATLSAVMSTQDSQEQYISELIAKDSSITAALSSLTTESASLSVASAQNSLAQATSFASLTTAIQSAATQSLVSALSNNVLGAQQSITSLSSTVAAQSLATATTINTIRTVDIPAVAANTAASLSTLKANEVYQASSTANVALTGVNTINAAMSGMQAGVSSAQSTATAAQVAANSLAVTSIPAAASSATANAKVYTDSVASSINTNINVALDCASKNAVWDATRNMCGYPRPDFESNWMPITQQAGTASFLEVAHGFNAYPGS